MQKRYSSESGIAIGVILFGLALIAVVTVAMTAGGNMMTSPIAIDRVDADLKTQGQLILSKIRQCFTNGVDNKKLDCSNNTWISSTSSWSRSGCSPIDTTGFYSASSGNGITVDSIDCPSYATGLQNLWTGQQISMLPPPTSGFDSWYYVNAGDSGGRCIRTQPLAATVNDQAIRNGLIQAATAFAATEVSFNPSSTSQRFILWVTPPTGTVSADCAP